jgi:hypothetical protein
MASKLTILTHEIAIQLHLVAESCTICSSRSRRPVRKLLDTTWMYSLQIALGEECVSDSLIVLRTAAFYSCVHMQHAWHLPSAWTSATVQSVRACVRAVVMQFIDRGSVANFSRTWELLIPAHGHLPPLICHKRFGVKLACTKWRGGSSLCFLVFFRNDCSCCLMNAEWHENISTVKCKGLGRPSVGIALGYGLDDRGSRVRFPTGARNFSLHHRVRNGSGAHPASYPMGIPVVLSLGVKRSGGEADHSPPFNADVKKMHGAIPPLPNTSSWRGV